ncbi:MAG: YveK family protein [Massiliimalia sp.]
MEQQYDTLDLREIVLVLKKNFTLLITVTVLAAVIGFITSAFFVTPEYEASATLIVNSREDQQTQNVVTNDQINSAKQLINTYAVILTSDTVLNETIDELGLNLTYEQLLKKVTISPVEETQVMRIAVRDADPWQAKQIVSSIMDQAPEMIIHTVKAGSVEPISLASVGDKPVSPNLLLNSAVSGLIGLVGVCGFIFLRGMLNNRLMTDEDISKKLGLTVLGVIPYIDFDD